MLRVTVRTIAALSSLLAFPACVRISATRISGSAVAVSADSVQVFATQKPGEYREIAVLTSHRFLVSDARTLAALRKRAAQLGANGLLLVNADDAATQRHSGTAVVWTPGSKPPTVVTGNASTSVDEFEKAIAIRFEKH